MSNKRSFIFLIDLLIIIIFFNRFVIHYHYFFDIILIIVIFYTVLTCTLTDIRLNTWPYISFFLNVT